MVTLSSFSTGTPEYDLAHSALLKFQEWRESVPRGSRRIPEHLWLIAARLSRATSVHKVSRLLSLDYRKLKDLTNKLEPTDNSETSESIAILESLLQEKKKPILKADKAFLEGKARAPEVEVQAHLSPDSSQYKNIGKDRPARLEAFSCIDGFIEALGVTDSSLKTIPKHEVLAQIRSPGGHVLELYSGTTSSIIEAFVRL